MRGKGGRWIGPQGSGVPRCGCEVERSYEVVRRKNYLVQEMVDGIVIYGMLPLPYRGC